MFYMNCFRKFKNNLSKEIFRHMRGRKPMNFLTLKSIILIPENHFLFLLHFTLSDSHKPKFLQVQKKYTNVWD